ncbi:MAG: tyrosine-type recombinase/integrase [Campylobacterota bacterium]|nr:tyrosine-type recombinase/integrase [Campylobacterota bacterium]
MELQKTDLIGDLERWKVHFLDKLKALGRSRNTFELYERSANQFIEYMHKYQEDIAINEISSVYITGYLSFLEDEAEKRHKVLQRAQKENRKRIAPDKLIYLSKTSKEAYLKSIKQYFGFISDNNDDLHAYDRIFKKLDIAGKGKQSDKMEYLSEDQVGKLSNFIEREKGRKGTYQIYMKAMLIKLMLHAGLRISEALKVRLCDFSDSHDDDVYAIRIDAKGGKTQTAYIVKYIIDDEIDYMREQGKDNSDPLFLNKNNKNLDRHYAFRQIQTIYRHAGLGIDVKGLHLLRHTLGMRLVRNKVSPLDIQRILRHEKLETTMTYVRALKEDVTSALKSLTDNGE